MSHLFSRAFISHSSCLIRIFFWFRLFYDYYVTDIWIFNKFVLLWTTESNTQTIQFRWSQSTYSQFGGWINKFKWKDIYVSKRRREKEWKEMYVLIRILEIYAIVLLGAHLLLILSFCQFLYAKHISVFNAAHLRSLPIAHTFTRIKKNPTMLREKSNLMRWQAVYFNLYETETMCARTLFGQFQMIYARWLTFWQFLLWLRAPFLRLSLKMVINRFKWSKYKRNRSREKIKETDNKKRRQHAYQIIIKYSTLFRSRLCVRWQPHQLLKCYFRNAVNDYWNRQRHKLTESHLRDFERKIKKKK